jgi:hypothetical protein
MRTLVRTVVIIIAVLALPVSAFATEQTWTTLGSRSVQGDCASGTCTIPTTSTRGMSLDNVMGTQIQVCAADADTLSDGTSIDIYFYAGSKWGYWRSYTVAMQSPVAQCGWLQDDSPGLGIPNIGGAERMAAVPNGMATTAAGHVYVKMWAVSPTRTRL